MPYYSPCPGWSRRGDLSYPPAHIRPIPTTIEKWMKHWSPIGHVHMRIPMRPEELYCWARDHETDYQTELKRMRRLALHLYITPIRRLDYAI